MENGGRIVAGALAVGSVLLTAGLVYWAADTDEMIKASFGASAAAALGLPFAWLLGGRYDRLKARAIRDFLTGLYNRSYMEEIFPRLARQALRRREKVTVLLLDVNNFKEVNDRLGHAEGDRALKLISEALLGSSQSGEIVGRWGGDEFVMLAASPDERLIESGIRRLQDRLQGLPLSTELGFSISVGSASFPDNGADLQSLVRIADKRMYADKYLNKARAFGTEAMEA